MSLITQCPACATMFRVVPDQLRISDGWVRCGQCDEVFDANAHLQALDEAALQPERPRVEEVVTLASHEDSQPGALARAEPETTAAYDWGGIVAEPPAAALASVPVPDQVQVTGADEQGPAYQPEIDPFLAQSPSDLLTAEGVLASNPAADEPPAHPGIADEAPLSFMPQTREATLFSRLMAGPLWWVLGSVGACVLVGQMVFAERNRLSVLFPPLQPALGVMCDVLDCSLSAPQQIDALAIDSSTFTNIRPGIYTLTVTLKNTAALALEVPALELTLTDLQDKPLLRRVLLANEYANARSAIAAGEEFSAAVPVSVQASSAAAKVTGYKLLAFYP